VYHPPWSTVNKKRLTRITTHDNILLGLTAEKNMEDLGLEICENLRNGGWKTGRQIRNEIETKTGESVSIGVMYITIQNLVLQDEIRERKLKETDIYEFCLTPKGCRQKNKNESVIPKKDFIIA
jgi:hypothetical protein